MLHCSVWSLSSCLTYDKIVSLLVLEAELVQRLGPLRLSLVSPAMPMVPADTGWEGRRLARLGEREFFSQLRDVDAIVLVDAFGGTEGIDNGPFGRTGPAPVTSSMASRSVESYLDSIYRLAGVRPLLWHGVAVPDDCTSLRRHLADATTASHTLSVADPVSLANLEAVGLYQRISVVPDLTPRFPALLQADDLAQRIARWRRLGVVPEQSRLLTLHLGPAAESVLDLLARALDNILIMDDSFRIIILPSIPHPAALESPRRLQQLLQGRGHAFDEVPSVVDLAAILASSQGVASFHPTTAILAGAMGVPSVVLGEVDATLTPPDQLIAFPSGRPISAWLDEVLPRLRMLLERPAGLANQSPPDSDSLEAYIDSMAALISRPGRTDDALASHDRDYRQLLQAVTSHHQEAASDEGVVDPPAAVVAAVLGPPAERPTALIPAELLRVAHLELLLRDNEIRAGLTRTVQLRERVIVSEATVDAQTSQMAWLKQELAVRDQQIGAQQEAIGWLKQELAVRDQQIGAQQEAMGWLQQELAMRQAELVHQEQVIAARDQAISWLQHEQAVGQRSGVNGARRYDWYREVSGHVGKMITSAWGAAQARRVRHHRDQPASTASRTQEEATARANPVDHSR